MKATHAGLVESGRDTSLYTSEVKIIKHKFPEINMAFSFGLSSSKMEWFKRHFLLTNDTHHSAGQHNHFSAFLSLHAATFGT